MPSLRIILLCVLSIVAYGVSHDLVTTRVCVEYFTVGHTPPFPTESPTLLALTFGILATWWVGLIFGLLVAAVTRAGSWPKFEAADLLPAIACLLTVMAVASILAGVTGYRIAEGGGFTLPEPLSSRISPDRHALFFADSLAHLAAYSVGVLGAAVLCGVMLIRRRKIARSPTSVDAENTCPELLGAPWPIVASRWTARVVGLPLFCLVLILTLGDGVPALTGVSAREGLFITVNVTLLLGLLLAWKWEGIGSLLILAAFALLALAGEPFLLGIVFVPWLITGLAGLVSWVGGRRIDLRRTPAQA